jgi:hypothetical protein
MSTPDYTLSTPHYTMFTPEPCRHSVVRCRHCVVMCRHCVVRRSIGEHLLSNAQPCEEESRRNLADMRSASLNMSSALGMPTRPCRACPECTIRRSHMKRSLRLFEREVAALKSVAASSSLSRPWQNPRHFMTNVHDFPGVLRPKKEKQAGRNKT